jgi:hypothetical protein
MLYFAGRAFWPPENRKEVAPQGLLRTGAFLADYYWRFRV